MKVEPLILALETSIRNGSISILKGKQEIASFVGRESVIRSEDLLRKINDLLTENHLSLDKFDAIAVSTGPGSFTGLRVGIATGKALAFGAGKDCLGVSVLDALSNAYQIDQTESDIIVVVPSGRNEIFWQYFIRKYPKIGIPLNPQAGTLKDLQQIFDSIKTNVSIVAELEVCEKARDYFQSSSNCQINLICASDNVAKFIAYSAVSMLRGNYTHESVYPRYILKVEVEKPKQI